MRNNDVRWNFEKFLISRKGKPVKRYDASSRVSDMHDDIESLLFPSLV
jgi:glutathione peroxidase